MPLHDPTDNSIMVQYDPFEDTAIAATSKSPDIVMSLGKKHSQSTAGSSPKSLETPLASERHPDAHGNKLWSYDDGWDGWEGPIWYDRKLGSSHDAASHTQEPAPGTDMIPIHRESGLCNECHPHVQKLHGSHPMAGRIAELEKELELKIIHFVEGGKSWIHRGHTRRLSDMVMEEFKHGKDKQEVSPHSEDGFYGLRAGGDEGTDKG